MKLETGSRLPTGVFTPSTRRNSTVSSRRRCVLGIRQTPRRWRCNRGVYPYLPMATNAPWSIFGGMNKKLLKHVFALYIVFLSFSQRIFSLATLARLRFILNLQMQACNVFYQIHLNIFSSFFGVIIPDCQLPKFTENTHKIAQIAYKISKNCGGEVAGKEGETWEWGGGERHGCWGIDALITVNLGLQSKVFYSIYSITPWIPWFASERLALYKSRTYLFIIYYI